MATFESGFDSVATAAARVAEKASTMVSTAKQLQKAAADGDICRIRKVVERLSSARDVLQQELDGARDAWPFTATDEQAYLESQYEGELVDTLKSLGLSVRQQDGCLVVYPVIVRVLAPERVIKIDRRKSAKLRPSKLAADLRMLQTKKPRLTSERFLEILYRAYRLLVRKGELGRIESLARVYEALTLLPGVAVDYDKMDFCRDLYLLDHSGVTATRSGASCSLPASTGTKGGKAFSFVGPDGEYFTYYGIGFVEAGR